MSVILVEVRPRITGDDDTLGTTPAIPEPLQSRIDELGASISEIATKLKTRIDGIGRADTVADKWALSELSLKFSLDLESEVGAVVARAKASAGFEAELKWSLKVTK